MARRRSRGEGHIRRRVKTRDDGTSYTRWSAIITLGIDPATGKQKTKEGPLRKTECEARVELDGMLMARKADQRSTATNRALNDYRGSWQKQPGT